MLHTVSAVYLNQWKSWKCEQWFRGLEADYHYTHFYFFKLSPLSSSHFCFNKKKKLHWKCKHQQLTTDLLRKICMVYHFNREMVTHSLACISAILLLHTNWLFIYHSDQSFGQELLLLFMHKMCLLTAQYELTGEKIFMMMSFIVRRFVADLYVQRGLR